MILYNRFFNDIYSPFQTPPPPTPRQKLVSFSVCLCVATAGREGKGGGRGAQSYGREKAWPSRNHSILSAVQLVEWRIYTFYSRYHCSFNTFFTGNIKGKLHFYSKRRIAKQLCIFAAAFFSISLRWRECWNRGNRKCIYKCMWMSRCNSKFFHIYLFRSVIKINHIYKL